MFPKLARFDDETMFSAFTMRWVPGGGPLDVKQQQDCGKLV
jgi:hypothetical protein